MSMKYVTLAILAAGVAGCASNSPPPPPPPMAMAPEPVTPVANTAPARMSGMAGLYRGRSEATGTLARGCRAPGPVSVRVLNNNSFTALGMRGRINPDGTIGGSGLSGNVSGGTMTLTTSGRCGYTVNATKA